MRKMLTALAIAGAICGVGAAGPGCSNLPGPNPITTGTKMDEVALGLAVSAGAAANNSYALAIETGVLKDRALSNNIYLALDQYDKLLAAARQAKALGDAAGYLAKLQEAQLLYTKIVALIPAKRS